MNRSSHTYSLEVGTTDTVSNDGSDPPAKENDHCRIIQISHRQGRPDIEAIVGDAMMRGEGQHDVVETIQDNIDLGVFMCGPTNLTDSVWKAIKDGEKTKRRLRHGSKPVAVYQEVFEL